MRKIGILFLTILSFSIQISACLNELRVDLEGIAAVGDDRFYVPEGHRLEENKSHYTQQLHKLDSLWKADNQIEDYLDYGVNLVYLGRYQEAKEVFINAEKLQPGLYATAANLGTAYELLGENELALKWISKAVEIDPESHEGSEWLHVKILEAKIKGDNYITSNFLISTHFGNELIPKTKLNKEELTQLRDAIYYQLNERVSFVKPKDKIVAMLLFDLGNICALLNDVTSTLRVYDRAKIYGYDTELFKKRYAELIKIHKDYDHKEMNSEGVIIGSKEYNLIAPILLGVGAIFFILAIGALFYVKKRKK